MRRICKLVEIGDQSDVLRRSCRNSHLRFQVFFSASQLVFSVMYQKSGHFTSNPPRNAVFSLELRKISAPPMTFSDGQVGVQRNRRQAKREKKTLSKRTRPKTLRLSSTTTRHRKHVSGNEAQRPTKKSSSCLSPDRETFGGSRAFSAVMPNPHSTPHAFAGGTPPQPFGGPMGLTQNYLVRLTSRCSADGINRYTAEISSKNDRRTFRQFPRNHVCDIASREPGHCPAAYDVMESEADDAKTCT